MAGTYRGKDPELFQRLMGRGGMIGSTPRQLQKSQALSDDKQEQSGTVEDESAEKKHG